jgi:hypothetical protein
MADKVRFLSRPLAYAGAPRDIIVIETHMSFVFLAGERAYKFEKPVRFPFLDFSTLHAAEFSRKMTREQGLRVEMFGIRSAPSSSNAASRLSYRAIPTAKGKSAMTTRHTGFELIESGP